MEEASFTMEGRHARTTIWHGVLLKGSSSMARRQHRPPATKQALLEPHLTVCWECGERMWVVYLTERMATTLHGTDIQPECRCPTLNVPMK